MTQGFQPRFTITNRITEGLTRIERARGFLEAAILKEEGGNRVYDPLGAVGLSLQTRMQGS